MKNSTKRNVLFVVAIVAALGMIFLFGGGSQFGTVIISDVVPSSGTVEGEVLAIETTAPSQSPPRKEAVVKLTTGETVRAYVPPACVVFTGQIATLAKYGSETIGAVFYVLNEAREKNDS